MDLCEKCGKPLTFGRKFCTNCGAKVPQKEEITPKEKENEFPQAKFDKKLLSAKKSINLLKARDLFNSCLELLKDQPPDFNPKLKSEVQSLLEANEAKIKATTEEFLAEIARNEKLFESKEFIEIPDNLDHLKSEIKTKGIENLQEKVKILYQKNHKSLDLQRNLEKYEIPIPSDIIIDLLERKYFSLDKLLKESKKETLIHPELISQLKETHQVYMDSMHEHGFTELKASFGKSLKMFSKNLGESRNIKKINRKYAHHLSSAENTSDLLHAKEELQQAEELLNDSGSKIIFADKQEEYKIILSDVDSKIAQWKEKMDSEVKKAKTLMNKLNFNDVKLNLENLNKELKSNGLNNFVENVNKTLKKSNINSQIYNEIQVIGEQCTSKAYFEAFNKMENLNKKISTEFSSENIISNINKEIKTLTNKINIARSEEEKSYQEDLTKTWDILQDQLTFEDVKNALNKKRIHTEKNGYPAIVTKIDELLQQLNQNNSIFIEYSRLTELIKKSVYGLAKENLKSLQEKISENPDIYFEKITQNIQDLEISLNNKIKQEEKSVKNKIKKIEKILEEENDIDKVNQILNEINSRNNETELTIFSSLIEPISKKIALNKSAQLEQEDIKKLFSESQLKKADIECKKLLEKIDSALKESENIYSSTLRASVEMLSIQISDSLKKGIELLQDDFSEIDEKMPETLDFSEITQFLVDYKTRAQQFGLSDIGTKISDLEKKISKNEEFINEYNQLLSKYENLIDFIPTIKAINTLFKSSEKDDNLFDHVKKAIQDLQDRVEKEHSNRETKIKNALKKIIKNEINNFDFVKSIDSLNELLVKSQNLNVSSVIPGIQQNINFCTKNLPLIVKIEEVIAEVESGKLIEARKNLGLLKPNLPKEEKGLKKITELFNSRCDDLHSSIQNEIETQIDNIKNDLPRLIELVEDKKGEEAKISLIKARERAQYLGSGMLVAEIEDLLKICEMQLVPGKTMKAKQKQKRIKPIETKQPKPKIEKQVEEIAEKTPIIHKQELSQPTIPIRKTSKVSRTSKRTADSRKVLQKSNLRVTSRAKSSLSTKVCPQCQAVQPSNNEKFCFFCGKSLK